MWKYAKPGSGHLWIANDAWSESSSKEVEIVKNWDSQGSRQKNAEKDDSLDKSRLLEGVNF